MKERLIGAAVLVVAAVLIVPALLDGPRDETKVSRDLELPAPEAASTRTHVIEVPTPSRPGQTAPEPITRTAPVGEPAVAADAGGAGPQQARPAGQPDEPASRTGSPEAGQSDGWAVQVGSFTSESNARRLVELLRAADYRAFVTRNVVAGRVWFRVRVGPEPDRARAEALAERLREDRQQTHLVRHP